MDANRALLDLDRLTGLFPHGVARAADLVALGLPGARIDARCGPSGPWRRLRSGAVLLSGDPPARAQRLQDALGARGRGAVVTGREALWLHGLPVPPLGAIHLLVPAGRAARSDGEVVVERTTRLPDPLWRAGFPVAPLPRALVDAGRRTPSADEARALVLEAVHRGGASLDHVHAELARAPGRGAAALRRALAEIDRGVRSAGARAAREVVARAGLPPPRWGARLSTARNVHLGVVDAWWDDVGLAWDADLLRPWAPRDGAAAAARAARFLAVGVVAVRTAPDRLREEPAAVADELRAARGLAAARPRPGVVVSP